MAITVVNSYEAQTSTNGTTTLDVASVVVPAGALLVAAVGFNNDVAATQMVSSITLRSGATTVGTFTSDRATNNDDDGYVTVRHLSGTSAGTYTVRATFSAGLNSSAPGCVIRVYVLTGAATSSLVRDADGSTGIDVPPTSVTLTTAPGDWMLAVVFGEDGAAPAAITRTSPTATDVYVTSGEDGILFSTAVASGASTVWSWGISGGTSNTASAVVAYVPAADTPEGTIAGTLPRLVGTITGTVGPAPGVLEAALTTQPYPGFTGDVADGAAIVYDQADPSASVVIGTNKAVGGGLYVFDLDGQILSQNLDGAANSVDWRDLTGVSGWDDRILVMTCDRDTNALRYYWMNRTTKALTAAGSTSLAWEPYGTCLYVHTDGQVYAFVSQRGPDDTSARNFYQYPLSRSGSTVAAGSVARTVNVANVVEGMAADDVTGYLFVSQEDVGLYRYSAAPGGGSTRTAVDTVGAGNLVADVEDVAIARTSAGAWLLVSSQGDSSYHVYDLATLAHEQRFTAARPDGTTPVVDTDGLDVYLGDFGSAFPDGLIVVHDAGPNPSRFAFLDAGLVFGDLPVVVTGTLAGVLPRVTGATTGQVRVAAALSGSLPKITGATTGAVRVSGTLAGTLPTLAGSLTGDVLGVVTGGISGTLPRVTGAASGTVAVPATLAAPLPAIVGTTSGGVTYTGTLSGTLPAIRGSITSADVVAGTLAATLPTITGAATGQQTITGTIAGQLPAVEGVTAGQVRIGGTLAATLPRLTGHITGTSESAVIIGILAGVLPRLTGSLWDVEPVEPELAIGRGPYGHPLTVGSPRGNPLAVSSPRR